MRILLVIVLAMMLPWQPVSAQTACGAGGGERVAASVQGGLTTFRTDTGASCVLTPPVANPSGMMYAGITGAIRNPVLSPGGDRVAYLVTTGNHTHDVFVIPVGGPRTAARRVTPTSATIDRTEVAWSPDGTELAIMEAVVPAATQRNLRVGPQVVVRRLSSPGAPVLQQFRLPYTAYTRSFSFGAGGPPLVWSPDGKTVATIAGKGNGATLRVMLMPMAGGPPRTIYAAFPGSTDAPDTLDLGWTADGASLLVGTVIQAQIHWISGVWRVPRTGGNAVRLLGLSASAPGALGGPAVRGGNGATGATQMAVSPNHQMLATNAAQGQGVWVQNLGTGSGRVLSIGTLASICSVAQMLWLPDSSGLAVVTECISGGPQEHLLFLPLQGAMRELATVNLEARDPINLTPPRQCSGCL